MKLGELWRRWQRSGLPDTMVTETEAIERVRQYAEAHGYEFHKPSDVRLEGRPMEPGNGGRAGSRMVYVIALGTWRPVPFVEVDAATGEVLLWRALSR